MISKEQICRKIEEVIPEAGKCDVDYHVEYDEKNDAWVVDLKDGSQHLRTFLENYETEECVEEDHCIPLGLQIGALKHNLKLYHHC